MASHLVGPGETLSKIAQRYKVSVEELEASNSDLLSKRGRNHIEKGWKIQLPPGVPEARYTSAFASEKPKKPTGHVFKAPTDDDVYALKVDAMRAVQEVNDTLSLRTIGKGPADTAELDAKIEAYSKHAKAIGSFTSAVENKAPPAQLAKLHAKMEATRKTVLEVKITEQQDKVSDAKLAYEKAKRAGARESKLSELHANLTKERRVLADLNKASNS